MAEKSKYVAVPSREDRLDVRMVDGWAEADLRMGFERKLPDPLTIEKLFEDIGTAPTDDLHQTQFALDMPAIHIRVLALHIQYQTGRLTKAELERVLDEFDPEDRRIVLFNLQQLIGRHELKQIIFPN